MRRKLARRPTTHERAPADIVILVRPAAIAGRYDAYHDALLLCRDSRQPFLDAARVLIQRCGTLPSKILQMRWAESGVDSLRSTAGCAAGLAIHEGLDKKPTFVRYRDPSEVFRPGKAE